MQATLADICDQIAMQVDPASLPGSRYLGLEHIESGKLRANAGDLASTAKSAKWAFKKGDVLYGKLRPYLDKAVLADSAGICSTELLVLRPKPSIDPRFLSVLVHTPEFIQHAVEGTAGANHPRTSWAHIREFTVPELTVHDQSRIADLVWTIYECSAAQDTVLRAVADVKRSALQHLFSRGLRDESQKETEFGPIPESWPVVVLNDCANVQTGAAKGRSFNGHEVMEVPYLRVANVQNGYLDLTEIKTLRIAQHELERFRLRRNDVLLTEGGDFDKLGRGFIWNAQIEPCIHQNHIFAVRVNANRIDPQFFAYLVQSPYGRAYFLQVAHKTTNLACINSTKLKAFPVPIPLLQEQREIASILATIDAKIDLHRRKRAVLDELFRTFLHKLMTGEIRVGDLDLGALPDGAEAAA